MAERVIDLEKWNLHKQELYGKVASAAGETKAKKFLKHYASRYDSYGRSYLDWRLAYSLMDDFSYCKRVGTRWFAFVGSGGTGKTTLAKNVFYWLDPSFNPKDLTLNVENFIRGLGEADRHDAMKALFMDEPDDDIHPQTELGKRFRKILGKARQGRHFFGICATDLTDIPPYIFRKIDVVVFTPYLGKYMLFKNRPKLKSYLIQRIRKEYQEKGYMTFFELSKEEGCLNGFTRSGTPWSEEQEVDYLKAKKDDYQSDIADAIKMIENKDKPKKVNTTDDYAKSVISRYKKGISFNEIARQDGKQDTKKIRKIWQEHLLSLGKNLPNTIHSPTANLDFSGVRSEDGGLLISSFKKKKGGGFRKASLRTDVI